MEPIVPRASSSGDDIQRLQADADDAAIYYDYMRTELWRAADRMLITERRVRRADLRQGARHGSR